MTEQLGLILKSEKQEALISLLKELNAEQKKQLVPVIKKFSREYNEIIQTEKNTYASRGTAEQQRMITIAAFVCCNKADYVKHFFASWILEEKILKKVINWYCPDWFSDFVNSLATQEYIYHAINYDLIIDLSDKGLVQPNKALIAKLLPQVIFENNDRKWVYKPGNILKHPVTIQEHIWYLFEEESNIHYSNRWLNFDTKEKAGWIELFTQYSAEGKIERSRLLEQTLLASNKNFNKVLSGWFSELFVTLDPGDTEILSLQKHLFSVLSSPHSKAVNTALQYLKKIIAENTFDTVTFLDNTPVLLTSDTKSVVVATLGILEKIAKKKKELQLPVCKAVVQAFINTSDEVQAKAAKIIAIYQGKLDSGFADELQPYYPSLLSSAKKILDSFYSPVEIIEEEDTTTNTYIEETLQEIQLPENIDDLVFLASQAFDNNHSWHIDILPAALIKWQHHLKGENIDKLEPALQRALKMTKAGINGTQGSLDHMLAIFFIDVCIYLSRKFPADAKLLQALFSKFNQVNGEEVNRWMDIEYNKFYMEGWDNYYHDPFFTPHKQLLITALQKIKEQDDLPLLSTPTHEPGWILPETLVKRIVLYKHKEIFNIDFQVALSRCFLKDTATAITIAEKELTGEHKNLLLFLLGKDTLPKGPFTNTAVWMCCSLALKEKKTYTAFNNFSFYKKRFENYTGQFPWQSVEEEYEIDRYDYQQKKSYKEKAKRKIINIDIKRSETKESAGLKKFFSGILQKDAPQALLYDYLIIKAQWLTASNDIRRILLLTPNNPEAFLVEIIKSTLRNPYFFGEDYKRVVIASLKLFYEIWDDYGEMAYLFLGTCMLSSDKTVINIAGETWLKAVSAEKMNNEQLGKVIGAHESIEFAPLKRFTDLISQSLFKVSALHNKNLRLLIETIFIALPDAPIKNLKKLLELYNEVIAADKIPVTDQKIISKLMVWNQNSGIQKIIKTITA